ncbi:MAG: hypothetical protein AB7K52_10965 [Phycisphaerales bacterium]
MSRLPIFASLGLLAAAAHAEPFQLLVTVSPPGSISNPANWQPVQRFNFANTGSAPSPISDIPANQVNDPAGIGFRTATDLFVGNRHGNVLGMGSVSRFTISADGQTATPNGSFTAPGMIGVHDIAFSPTTGELFAACVNNGIFRFRFDGAGNPIANGSFAPGVRMRGVAIHPSGRYIYTTSASSQIGVYRLELDDSVTQLPSIFPPGASNLHFFAVHPDGQQLYLGDIGSSVVFRFRMGSGGELSPLPSTPSPSAIDIAFSPDGLEMFAGSHFAGGITRYTFDAGSNTWSQSGTISTPSMGAFAIYTPTATPCFADFNGDGNLDPDDLGDYINCYFALPPCPAADFNSDGNVDPDDLGDYINVFFFGCP